MLKVCVLEWDGQQRLSITVDIWCYIFVLEDIENQRTLALDRALQRHRGDWIGTEHQEFIHRPELIRARDFSGPRPPVAPRRERGAPRASRGPRPAAAR